MGEFAPAANMSETENGFEVTAELPGMKPEEIKVEMKNGHLWISGKKEEEAKPRHIEVRAKK